MYRRINIFLDKIVSIILKGINWSNYLKRAICLERLWVFLLAPIIEISYLLGNYILKFTKNSNLNNFWIKFNFAKTTFQQVFAPHELTRSFTNCPEVLTKVRDHSLSITLTWIFHHKPWIFLLTSQNYEVFFYNEILTFKS